MTYVFLPYENTIWLHQLTDTTPIPLIQMPGNNDARYFMSTDYNFFAFLDQANKRVGLYEFLDSEPWFEKKMSPVTLPKNCSGDDLLIHNNIIYVGGRSKAGEFLWQKDIDNTNWQALPFPKDFAPMQYKSIDLLFLDGNKLIAVNDIIFPKWIFTYDISEREKPKPVDIISLEQHTTYESVYAGADNDNYIAILSGGINHGHSSRFVSLLDKKTLKEKRCWSAYLTQHDNSLLSLLPDEILPPEVMEVIIENIQEFGTEDAIKIFNNDKVRIELKNPKHIETQCIYNVAFLGDYLLLATGDGLIAVYTKSKKRLFKQLALKTLLTPYDFAKIPKSESALFVIGQTADEQITYEIITVQDLKKSIINDLNCRNNLDNRHFYFHT